VALNDVHVAIFAGEVIAVMALGYAKHWKCNNIALCMPRKNPVAKWGANGENGSQTLEQHGTPHF
jgi:hypothetical protein